MTGEIKNIIKVASVYVVTIIGAGFASGQEILQFFSTYYKGGFYGIIVSGILFSTLGYIVLNRVYRDRIRNYDEFLIPTVGWFMGWVVNIASALLMLSVYSIMIAGAGSVFQDKLGMSFSHGIIIMTALCMFFILWDIKGITALSTAIAPILTFGIIIIGIFILSDKYVSVFNISGDLGRFRYNWLASSLLYVGYNSILSVAIMCSLLPQLKTRKVGAAGGIIGGLLLCLIALILNTVMMFFMPDIMEKELPVLTITMSYGNLISSIYALLLWLAMCTSAVTSGYCFIDRLSSKINWSRKMVTLIVCPLIIPLASFGFSNLISAIYPVFGYIGLFLVFAILIQEAAAKIRIMGKK